jgi:hypothetical protein
MNGFTADAERTLRNRSSNMTDPLIVPITGDRIRQALQDGEKLDRFFQESVREIKYLRH